MTDRTIDDVLDGLDAAIDRALAAGDRTAYFAALYRVVTSQVKVGLESGFFDDAERMARLDVLFADRYLDAVCAHELGGIPTASWQLTFAVAGHRRPLVLQHLLVGINAHINLDLGVAAARCVPGTDLPGLRRDYDRVNAILAAMIAVITEELRHISPWLGLLDVVGARTQTELVRFSVVAARTGAWHFATQLASTPEDGWPDLVTERDRRVARVGERVLRPGPRTSTALLLARLRERHDLAANVELLLGVTPPPFEDIASRVDEPTLR